ncbi:fructose-bisphosphate aldolase-lysine N-methyltransferase, chloroplastic isoform X2 [Impatiens glandulifera]|uniref:fructose-bisphosphate aldolase-lysine N-methyltransferase, chloroplastic isoform X2 n=1 Tax=Impatiens glandulifera TaxID=253017 RepID=UPI001FB0F413|nr:fructose-bisphosphate aldolase-lysine N-methyltransferase, chloroplastic isoform X2 [Impatiens glandulifera]
MSLAAKAILLWSVDILGSKWPIFTLSSRMRTCNLNFSTSSSTQVTRCFDEDCDDFLPWLEKRAGTEISSVLSIAKSAYGRSLYASKSIEVGDFMLRIPLNVQLSPCNLLPEINDMLSDNVGDVTKLAIVVLFEQRMGLNSDWAPYISRLPHPEEMHNTIFWSQKELAMIRPSTLYHQTMWKNMHIHNEFLSAKPALDCYTGTSGQFDFDDFRHAYALVESRAWRSTKGVYLIPFADFLNHDGLSETIVLYDDHTGQSEVIADQKYAPGEQVFIRYGKFSNATLLLDFGFALPHNNHDEVTIHVKIPHHGSPLSVRKMELLKRFTPNINKDVHNFHSSWDSFTIREVKSAKGKGKGIPQSLRAFARVICCTSSQELDELENEASKGDGRIARLPLRNSSKEIEAHKFLLSQITLLITEYISSLKSIETTTLLCMTDKYTLRKKMARDLLIGEVRILKSASDWLKNYCVQLLDL